MIIVYGYSEYMEHHNQTPVIFPITFKSNYTVVSNVITQTYQYCVSSIIKHDLNGCTFCQAQASNGTSYPINYIAIGT